MFWIHGSASATVYSNKILNSSKIQRRLRKNKDPFSLKLRCNKPQHVWLICVIVDVIVIYSLFFRLFETDFISVKQNLINISQIVIKLIGTHEYLPFQPSDLSREPVVQFLFLLTFCDLWLCVWVRHWMQRHYLNKLPLTDESVSIAFNGRQYWMLFRVSGVSNRIFNLN